MFYFRIDRVRFLDNGGVKSGLGIFGHDFAKVKFLSFITRADESVPELDEWVRSNDAVSRSAMLQALVDNTLSTRVLRKIEVCRHDLYFSRFNASRSHRRERSV
jgi:hypothetical protein